MRSSFEPACQNHADGVVLTAGGRHMTADEPALRAGATRGYSRMDQNEGVEMSRSGATKRGPKNSRAHMERVGQVGLGIMGGAFARHLRAAGFDVSGYDIEPQRCAELRALGGRAESSVAAVARAAPVIITSLATLPAVEAAFFGRNGILRGGGEGTIIIEASTLPLETKLDVRDRCAAHGITVLDCPISGTGAQAAAKDISVYASGPEDVVTRCKSIFEGFARSTHYCGVFGNGSKLKFIANLLVTIHNVSAAEAIVLGERSGLDLDLLYDVIRDGAGTSRMFEVRGPLMIRNDYGEATMKVEIYQKDIDIISAFSAGLQCPTPLFDAARAYYAGAYAQGYAKQDTAAVCAVLENMAGIVRVPPARKRTRRSLK
jgi:3-hydroxyisobutyrate dehydrogenase-like beta-hydroxyacid dehydrogenase